MIGTYYKLALLPDEVRAANKIRSKARLDCISFTDMVAGNYKGLTNFVNHKGQLFFYKTPCRDFVNTDSKRLAEWSLTGNGLNFSSIYIDDLDCPEIGYGYPNANRLLSNGSINPLFEFRNDGYLFLIKAGRFDLSKTLQGLSGITEHTKDDGQVYVSGFLKNYKVNISGQGVSLKGSLAKYFLPENFHTLTRSDSARAFEMMADELYLPIQKANINRIDFAQNFLMDFEPEAYYNFLGECQYYNRQPQSKSLYYSNGLRQKVFYNKIAEGKAKGLRLPDVWNGQNVLRYEMRFTSRLPKQFNHAEITASSLSNEKFYMAIFDKWLAEYEAINKLHSINFNLSDMNSPKDFWKQINLMAINMIGQDKIMQEIENLRNQRAFDKPEYYSRLKKEIKELCNTPKMTASSDLVAELDKKIKSSKRYYR